MKTRIVVYALIILCFDSLLQAQLDFAIPDVPAFAVVQVQPVTILRVSSPKEVAVNLAELANTSNNSPWGLEYNFKPRMNVPISLSIASCLSNNRSVGIGLRWDVVNNIEIQKTATFMSLSNSLKSVDSTSDNAIVAATKIIAWRHHLPDSVVERSPIYQEEISKVASEMVDASAKFINLRKQVQREVEALLWRKTIVSLAAATNLQSKDGTYTNIELDNRLVQVWLSSVIELDTHFVFNTSASYRLRSFMGQDTSAFSIGGRIMGGYNSCKGIADLSYYTQKGNDVDLTYSLGIECRVLDNYWLFVRMMYPGPFKKVIPMLELRVGQ